MTLNFSTGTFNSNPLTKAGDLTCGNSLMTGINISTSNNSAAAIGSAQCGTITLSDDIYNLKKGTKLNNLCQCEDVTGRPGQDLTCPTGKFISTYYPLLNKVTCCKSCSPDNLSQTTYTDPDCTTIFKNKGDPNQSCPANHFLKSISVTPANTKLVCCPPSLSGSFVEKADQLQSDCDLLGINKDKCTAEFLNEVKHRCQEYGIPANTCNLSSLQKLEGKCNQYGMRYFDINANKYKNTDSYVTCHNDNFSKLDKDCKTKNIGPKSCNFYNIKDKPIKDLQQDIMNLDAVDNDFELKMQSITQMLPNTTTTRVFSFLCVISFLIVIGILIYLLTKNQEK